MVKKIIGFVSAHKLIALVLTGLAIFSGYLGYQKFATKEESVRYVSESVKKGVLVLSISGTGQIANSNQVDIKPKVSGNIVSINAVNGQKVKKGDLVVQIDSREAATEVAEAKANLEVAQLDLQELIMPTDQSTLLQAKNSLKDAEDSLIKLRLEHENSYKEAIDDKTNAELNLEESYVDAYNEIADTFLSLPDVVGGVYNVILSNGIIESGASTEGSSNKWALVNSINTNDWQERDKLTNYLNSAEGAYRDVKTEYDSNFEDYREVSRSSEEEMIENLLAQTLETSQNLADLIKLETNAIDYWVYYRTENKLSVFSAVSTYQSNLSSYTGIVNNQISSLLSIQNSIKNYKESITDAVKNIADMEINQPMEMAKSERTLEEKRDAVTDLEEGATELEIRNKEIAVEQKRNALVKAQQTYSDYFITAPFDGMIVNLDVVLGDNVSGSDTVLTLITDDKIAEVTLNEIDIAKVKLGQKVILEFDAVPGLSVTGEVVEMDVLGTVTQGVVSYGVKIGFDIQDETVKSGMSVSASIIIETKPDVLLVPIGAIKASGDNSYVEVMVDGNNVRKEVTTGLSNDMTIEIIEGLNEGDEVITQTINSGYSSTAGSSSSESSKNQGPDAMGGAMMMMR